MILTILFIVFFVLWLVSLVPVANPRFGAYVGVLPWICVGLIAYRIGFFGGLH